MKIAAEAREVFCRRCKREVTVPEGDRKGHPYGWYYLSVQVPAWFNTDSRRPYRAIGLFCSAQCLADAIPELIADEELYDNAYEHE